MLPVTRQSNHTSSSAGQIFAHHPSCSLCAAAVCSAVCWQPECNEEHEKLGCLNIPNILNWPRNPSNRSAWRLGELSVARVCWLVGVTSPCSALVSSVRGHAMTAPVPSRVAHPTPTGQGLDTRPRTVQRFRVNINIT